ncbi:histone acetylation protein-domain-containing protein [Tribonema minus]|uniref:histone acetyltransferase n=1 Tax=Tribonema minus TaxID=303371 RepID=A0A835YX18_9STRA|nr:histone acetylation protein-domain-containing protein [Tribonema minus]
MQLKEFCAGYVHTLVGSGDNAKDDGGGKMSADESRGTGGDEDAAPGSPSSEVDAASASAAEAPDPESDLRLCMVSGAPAAVLERMLRVTKGEHFHFHTLASVVQQLMDLAVADDDRKPLRNALCEVVENVENLGRQSSEAASRDSTPSSAPQEACKTWKKCLVKCKIELETPSNWIQCSTVERAPQRRQRLLMHPRMQYHRTSMAPSPSMHPSLWRMDDRLQELKMEQPAGYSIFAVVPVNETVSFDVPAIVRQRCAASSADQVPLPETIPSTNKCICIYQVQEGQAVLLMVLYCHEYGKDAPACNAGRVYMSYLDTVALAKPAEARTTIYQEVVAAYMDWVRRRGFSFMHLWSWPPAKGDEYILVGHPLCQGTLPQPALLQWYRKLLARCKDELGLVADVTNAYDQYYVESIHGQAEDAVKRKRSAVAPPAIGKLVMPLFDGDFLVKAVQRDSAQSAGGSSAAAHVAAARDLVAICGDMQKEGPNLLVVRLAAPSATLRKDAWNQSAKAAEPWMEPLQLTDPDVPCSCEVFSTRDTFKETCMLQQLQFTSPTFAKHATGSLIFVQLHPESQALNLNSAELKAAADETKAGREQQLQLRQQAGVRAAELVPQAQGVQEPLGGATAAAGGAASANNSPEAAIGKRHAAETSDAPPAQFPRLSGSTP